MNSFREVIDLWPSLREFASDIGVKYGTAQVMRYRNSIASDHWAVVVDRAAERGFREVTYELMARLKATPPAHPKQRAETRAVA